MYQSRTVKDKATSLKDNVSQIKDIQNLKRIPKLHNLFKSYGNVAGWVDFAYGKGLRSTGLPNLILIKKGQNSNIVSNMVLVGSKYVVHMLLVCSKYI